MNPFQSFREYEELVYTLQRHFSSIKSSNLVVIRRGNRVAMVQGELMFAHGYRIVVPAPLMSFTRPNLPVLIQEIENLLQTH